MFLFLFSSDIFKIGKPIKDTHKKIISKEKLSKYHGFVHVYKQ